MDWASLQTNLQPYFPPPPPPSPPLSSNVESSGFSLNNKVSPSILLIIIILAIIFFISGLLHLLVRFLIRPPNRDPDDFDNVTALQGQLQQLFTLHDAGVDQSFIDTLPVFNYKSIIGVKNPFDCAVCLCEFEAEDKLRLLPKCSHAFHMECIDTWLLSHSTCPLCRGSLIPEFSTNNGCSPIVLVLESGSESSREIVPDNANSIQRENSQLGICCDDELEDHHSGKSCEFKAKEEEEEKKEKVVTIKLGKFKNVDGHGGEGSTGNNNNIDGRRCFSMGSFEYVMDENSALQVPIRTPVKKQSSKKSSLPLTPGHRAALSECGGDSRREFIGFEAFRRTEIGGGNSSTTNGGDSGIGRSKRESFSVSKIWLRGKKDKPKSTTGESSSRRSFSFRLPIHRSGGGGELKGKNGGGSVSGRTISEVDVERCESGIGRSSELGRDEDTQSCYSMDSQANSQTFPRTLLWFLSRQNKVVHSSFSPNNV